MKTNILTALFILFSALSTYSQTTSKRPWLLSQGAAAREAKRFTLQEWLENKERWALMDMSLSINTPSPYEFMVGGALQNYNLDTTSLGVSTSQSNSVIFGEVSAYAKYIGVTL